MVIGSDKAFLQYNELAQCMSQYEDILTFVDIQLYTEYTERFKFDIGLL